MKFQLVFHKNDGKNISEKKIGLNFNKMIFSLVLRSTLCATKNN